MGELTAGSFIIGAFNALAFTGTSFLFRSLDNSGYQKEMKRHNLAVEKGFLSKLASAKEKWYENQVRRKDRIQKLRRDMVEAGSDIAATNKALLEVQKITHNGVTFRRVPEVADFYEPSDEMKDLQYVVSGVAGLGIGAAGVALFL